MSFFCFDAGNISSRSTGTPRDTRKRRRMRDRTQLGGCKGGGATSCDHSERLRSVRNTEFWSDSNDGAGGQVSLVEGNNSSRYGLVAFIISSRVSNSLNSRSGFDTDQLQQYREQ